jgi:carbon-monoxide dehydrogenase small subunit
MLAVQADGAEVTTVEGLAREGELHPLQEALRDSHSFQCGFCTPGFVMTALELLEENPSPSEAEVREAISGNLCRCTGYQSIVAGILLAAERMR